MPAPVRYSPDVEQSEKDEAETGAALNETFLKILETTSRDYGHAVRSVHAKSHGLVEATLEVAEGLPPELAQGLFARPGRHQAMLRFSTNPGDILDDSVSVPRGLAVKILGVEGERLPGSEGDTTQDFILVDSPAFSARRLKDFLSNLKLLAKTTDRAQWAKKALSAVLRGAEAALETVGTESAMLKQLGGQQQTHPLGQTYFTQVPFRYGDHIAKLSVAPGAPHLAALADARIDIDGRADTLREEVGKVLAVAGGAWDLRVQLCTDLETMPVEDASVEWDAAISPWRTVARLIAAPQPGWSEARAAAVDDGMAFSPWHGLAAHRPLGALNRARRSAYALSTDYRGRFNGCPIHEPRGPLSLPD